MSIEIKNLCINVSVRPKETLHKSLDLENFRAEVLEECRQMVSESVVEGRER